MQQKTETRRTDDATPIRIAVLACTTMAVQGIETCLAEKAPLCVVGGYTWEGLDVAETEIEESGPDILYVFDAPGASQCITFLENMAKRMPDLTFIIQLQGRMKNQEMDYIQCPCVRGFLYPEDDADQFVKAAGAVMRNERWLRRSVYELYLSHIRSSSGNRSSGTSTRLTRREQQIAFQASFGISNREIASKLYISEATVKLHLNKIYRKLGIKNRTQLSRLALRYGEQD